MKFPALTEVERTIRLMPPINQVEMVLDTDTFNEVDDQFALAYALLSKERVNVNAVYTAPFSSSFFSKLLNSDKIGIPMTDDISHGLQQSYSEIQKIYQLLGMDSTNKVFNGSKHYMLGSDTPVESEAARDLVERAMAAKDVLYVVAIGAITNVASAILMQPEIIKKIVVVWLGGQPLYWPHSIEFNLGQDIYASQTIFNSGVPLVYMPCMSVASALTTTSYELNAMLNGKSKIGTYLSNIVNSQLSPDASYGMYNLLKQTYISEVDDYSKEVKEIESDSEMSPSRIIWDISTIGYMVNPNWCPSTLVSTPYITDDMRWKFDENRHKMRVCNYVHRDGIFGDMFKKLSICD